MSEDKELKQWKEKLFYQPKNGYDQINAEQTGEIFAYAEGYKQFLDAARTEREAVREAIRMAEEAGFVPYTFGMALQPGSKVYVNNRGKALMLAVLGEQPLDHGCVIAGAHIDSPRLDLKQTPMYEDSEHFSSTQHAVDVVRRMLHNNKLVFDASRPLVTGYLDKNIRISAIHSLIVGDEVGVSVSIRIVNPCKITKQQFIESEMCTEEIYEFLAISFVHGISQVYAGATGSGKTTIMADIMSNIPDHRRLITIEKSVREFDLVKRDENGEKINNVVHLVTYESDDPTRCVTMQDLLTKCLTMHPDAICVAEMKNEEAWEAQEAARTGHTVLTTTHASSVQGIYPRLATLCMQKHSTPYPTLISFVTEAFPLAVFLKKLDDGKRHIMEIAECLGCDEKGKVFTKTLWKYRVDSERIVDGKTVIDGRFVRVNPISKELRERMHENGVPNDVLDRFSEVR